MAVPGPYSWFTARLSWIEQTDSRFNYRASDSMRETRVNVRMRNRLLPVVSVAGVSLGATDTEGEDLTIRLTADPAPSSPLPVKLTIAVEGDFGVTPGERTVTIGTDGRGTLMLPTDDDSAAEPDGRIEVTLKPDSGYTFGQSVSYSAQILDNDGGGILGSSVPETQGDTVSPPEPPLVKYATLIQSFYDRITDQATHGDGPEGGWNKRFLKAMGHPEYVNYPQAAVTVARATEIYNHGGPGANTHWEGTAEAIQYKLDTTPAPSDLLVCNRHA